MHEQFRNDAWAKLLRALRSGVTTDSATSGSRSPFHDASLPKVAELPALTPRGTVLFQTAETIRSGLHSALPTKTIPCFAVGGFVRDAFRGADPRDLDLEVVSQWDQFVAAMHRIPGIEVGKIRPEFHSLECTLANEERVDILCNTNPHRLELSSLIRQSAGSRGFSINSMYCDIGSRSVYDFHGGEADLRQNQLSLLPEASFLHDGRLFMSGVALLVRFGFVPSDETEREFHRAGRVLSERWAEVGVPQSITGLVTRLVGRGVDLPGLVVRLARYGYLFPFARGNGAKAQRALNVLSRLSTAAPDDLTTFCDFSPRKKLAPFAAMIARRAPKDISVSDKADAIELSLSSLGYLSRGVSRISVVQEAQTPSLLTEAGRIQNITFELALAGQDADAFARLKFPPTEDSTRLGRVRALVDVLAQYCAHSPAQFRVLVHSRRLIPGMEINSDSPFVLMIGHGCMAALRYAASIQSLTLKECSPGVISLTPLKEKPVMVLHVKGNTLSESGCPTFVLHDAQARHRVGTSTGIFFDPFRKTVYCKVPRTE